MLGIADPSLLFVRASLCSQIENGYSQPRTLGYWRHGLPLVAVGIVTMLVMGLQVLR